MTDFIIYFISLMQTQDEATNRGCGLRSKNKMADKVHLDQIVQRKLQELGQKQGRVGVGVINHGHTHAQSKQAPTMKSRSPQHPLECGTG